MLIPLPSARRSQEVAAAGRIQRKGSHKPRCFRPIHPRRQAGADTPSVTPPPRQAGLSDTARERRAFSRSGSTIRRRPLSAPTHVSKPRHYSANPSTASRMKYFSLRSSLRAVRRRLATTPLCSATPPRPPDTRYGLTSPPSSSETPPKLYLHSAIPA